MAPVLSRASPPINQRFVWFLISLFLLAPVGRAQAPVSAGNPPATFSIDRNHPQIATLDGLWRFHPGDDPQWADPGFDDSEWPLIRSDKPWNEQGNSHTFGYAWYRFAFEESDGSRPLALLLPGILSGYKLYADGRAIGSAGAVTPSRNRAAFPQPEIFSIPADGAGPRTIHFAIRVWAYEPLAFWAGAGPRGPGSEIGDPILVAQRHSEEQGAYALNFVNEYAYCLLALIAGLTIFALFLFHPPDREYLWFSIVLLAQAVSAVLHLMLNLDSMPFFLWRFLALVVGAVSGAAILIFFSIILRRRRSLWWWIACIATVANILTVALIYFGWTSVGVSYAVSALLGLPLDIWVIAALAIGALRKDFSARLLLAPAALAYGSGLISFLGRITWQITGNQKLYFGDISFLRRPFPLGLDAVVGYIFILALLIFLVRRFSLARKEEERLAGEFESAKTIQSLLIPAVPPATPGFAVENVYLPAQEVGGDFFQVLPSDDGSLLIVVGDVSGKGLKAAMTVSSIIGALRDCTVRAPAGVLVHLNCILHGYISGFATCCATLIAADGTMNIANAGHLSPYLNGEELRVQSGLPLGIIAEATYEETRSQLSSGDRLTYVSDGVVEARNPSGELYGFERTQMLCGQSAQAIAEAAKRFGQEDDISVISVTLTGALAPAVAQEG